MHVRHLLNAFTNPLCKQARLVRVKANLMNTMQNKPDTEHVQIKSGLHREQRGEIQRQSRLLFGRREKY